MTPANGQTGSALGVVRVLMVDDSERLTRAWRSMLAQHADFVMVATTHTADNVPELVTRHDPAIVLLDLNLDGVDALDLIGRLAAQFPGVRIVIYSGSQAPGLVDRAIELGAWAFTSKLDDPASVLAVLRRVARGESVIPGT